MRTRRRIATPKSCHTDHEVHANDDHDDPDNHDDHEGGEQEEEPLPRQVAIRPQPGSSQRSIQWDQLRLHQCFNCGEQDDNDE